MKSILIDTSHLLYRSNYTFKTLTTSDGIPTGIHYGVIRTIDHIKRRFPDGVITFVLDGQPLQRKEFCPDYKANRAGEPEAHCELVHEFGLTMDIKALVTAAGCAVAYHVGFECDDVIAMFALEPERYLGFTGTTYIYSGDDDFCQLASNEILIWKPPINKSTPERVLLSSDVEVEWGVKPANLALYRSFLGDSGDNIRGLPRVPRNPLQQACAIASSPEEFYPRCLAFFNPIWKQRLMDFQSQCEINYRLTKLPWEFLPQLPLEFDESGLSYDRLKFLLEKLEFSSFLKQFGRIQEVWGPSSYAKAISGKSVRSEFGEAAT